MLTVLFVAAFIRSILAAKEDVEAPHRLPHAMISMLSPAISEHHKIQKVIDDPVKPTEIQESQSKAHESVDRGPQAVEVKPHDEETHENELEQTQRKEPQQAEQQVLDDDELPMPEFAVEKPALRGVPQESPREKGVPPALDLAHPHFDLNSSACVEVRKSTLPGAGDGCFALCDIPNGTLLGEYKGKTFMTSGKVPNDGAYTWKVPVCDEVTTVLTREDIDAWATCGNRNGFVYVDAADLPEHKFNPMRYVNGAWSKEQRKGVNVDAVINDRRVYYFSSKSVSKGDEMVIDYGPQYWAHDSSPPPPSPPPPAPEKVSDNPIAVANKFETEADDEAHSILEDADKLGARLRAAREKAKATATATAASGDDLWADEREADQGLVAAPHFSR